MRILLTIVAAVGLLLLAAPAGAPPAAVAAPEKCGNHAEPVPGGQQFERKYFWGNCENQGVRVEVWYRVYASERIDQMLCLPAQTDTLLGHTTNFVVSSYYVKFTRGAC
jgi:hypothetical protein